MRLPLMAEPMMPSPIIPTGCSGVCDICSLRLAPLNGLIRNYLLSLGLIVDSCSIACADAGGLYYRAPLVDFRLKQRPEPLRCRAFDNNAEWLEPGPHRGF